MLADAADPEEKLISVHCAFHEIRLEANQGDIAGHITSGWIDPLDADIHRILAELVDPSVAAMKRHHVPAK